MGVGGNFWDLLRPYARNEGFDFIRDKRVAVDLSCWVVQNETAIGPHARNPHLRLIFFRTVNLFAKFGAYPVFVVGAQVSGEIRRCCSTLPVPEDDGSPVERNQNFSKCIAESVELLKLLGVPVVKAKGEAAALCAQLNFEGRVDACITADSDAFMFGARCVIKHVNPNNNEPFECYNMSDIEAGLGLKRNHLIAISVLVGNDHNLGGVHGLGVDTALRFVKSFGEDEVLNRLREIRKGDDTSRIHLRNIPSMIECRCSDCDLNRKENEQKKNEDWSFNVCPMIAIETIELYSSDNNYTGSFQLRWENPRVDMLVDYLAFHLNWERSYIRQRILPMFCTIFLQKMALNSTNHLLNGNYKFDSILRVKVKFGHQFYVANWKNDTPAIVCDLDREDSIELTESSDDDPGPPAIWVRDGCRYLSTDENMSLVEAAFPEKVKLFWEASFSEKVKLFWEEKEEMRKSGKRKNQSPQTPTLGYSPATIIRQLNITEFYRSSKMLKRLVTKETKASPEGASSSNLRKRRRLSFS